MRPTRLAVLAAAALALSLAPMPRLAAQGNAAAAAPAPTAQAPAAAPAELRRSALPGDEQPRTLRAYWHVFAAFTIAWLLLFGYALSLGRRFRNLEREVDALRGTS